MELAIEINLDHTGSISLITSSRKPEMNKYVSCALLCYEIEFPIQLAVARTRTRNEQVEASETLNIESPVLIALVIAF